VSNSSKIVPHFHIPLQSGSDAILKGMRRRYLTDLYQNLIFSIKRQIPECCIGADVMVGFPGETEDLFMETYQFICDLPISYLHVFTYSERPNTPAAILNHSVSLSIRHNRSKMLRNLSDKKRREFYRGQLNQKHSVLIENDTTEGFIYGFTRNYVRVGIPKNTKLVNSEVKVFLEEIDSTGNVRGKIIESKVI
jgi:threonylcarbamoyladenosine tRNA methylthiotransferase MtaB